MFLYMIIILLFAQVHTLEGEMEIWDPEAVVVNAAKQVCEPVKPVTKLWSPSRISRCQISSQGLLSIDSSFADVYVRKRGIFTQVFL